MTKQLLLYVMCVGMLMSAPTMLAAQTREAERQTTVEGTVEAVDHTNRTVTIRLKHGKVVTLDVPTEAMRFDQVKVGDPVKASYYDWVSIRLKPAGEPPVDRTIQPTTVATTGSLPGATRFRQRVTTVTITGWDPCQQGRELHRTERDGLLARTAGHDRPQDRRGSQGGRSRRRHQDRSGDASASPNQWRSTAQPMTLRHRLTFSVLFGWDNQFSGKMIQQATGRTTGGAPINLDETTYDEVYGRIGMFKLGVGYRTSPRTEGVFNFVWSSSDASETATPIGTVGTTPRPAQCQFHRVPVLGLRGRPAVVLRPYPLHALRRLPRGHQPAPGHPRHVRRRACQCSRPGSPRRTASSSKSRGRSAWGRPAACSSALVPSR